jgi:flavocytochrome c
MKEEKNNKGKRKQTKVTRRDFLKYGFGMGTMLAVAPIPARMVGAATFIGPQPATKNYDVVVVGHGMAGMAAALAAGESGAKVAVLEKQRKVLSGGNSRISGGGFCIPKEDSAEAKELFTEDFMKKSGYRADKKLTESLAESILADIEWLIGHGVEFTEPAPFPPYHVNVRVARPGWYRGMPKLLDAIRSKCEDMGIVVHYETKAKELLIDSSGRIAGVRAATKDGFVDVRAGATVIATGGFAGNVQMLEKWVGADADESMVRGVKWATGEGHTMTADAGALLVQMAGLDGIHVGAVHPKNTAAANPFRILPYCVGINKNGKRYVDESLGYVAHGKAAMSQPDLEVALVFDQEIADRPEGKAVIDQFAGYGIEPLKADTLEQLAAKINAPANTMANTIKEFNAAVKDEQALDAEPAKKDLAFKIDAPPYYALYPLKPGITLTFGGIKVNSNRQALQADGQPIQGLYAAGECVGGYFLGDYVGGGSLTRCLVDGRIAGKNGAKG